ncbi:MAG: hypothetical protein IKU55_01470 [Clostridia bacterium]|nr:hypothetical protein [Clostridia bacterium]
MKNNKFLLPLVLIAVLFVAMLAAMFTEIVQPAAILPTLNIPNIVLLSVVTLLIEYFFSKGSPRCYVCIVAFGVAAFALLPLMAGFACEHDFWKYGLVGGIVFAVTTYLFTSATQRIKTGPKAPAAVVLTGFGIYLASQCFAGMIL